QSVAAKSAVFVGAALAAIFGFVQRSGSRGWKAAPTEDRTDAASSVRARRSEDAWAEWRPLLGTEVGDACGDVLALLGRELGVDRQRERFRRGLLSDRERARRMAEVAKAFLQVQRHRIVD